MDRQEELRIEIDNIWDILLWAKESYSYSLYLHKPDSSDEREYINSTNDFNFIRLILWKMTIVELSKLFKNSKSDRFNIFHFLNKLKKDGYFSTAKISSEIIEKWEKQLVENNETIKNILTLRDKVYSHTDANKEQYSQIEIYFKDVESLLALVENIVSEIHAKAFDSYAEVDHVFFDKENLGNSLRILAKERKEMRLRLFRNVGPAFE